MMYFVIIFCSPLYFLIRGRVGGFIFNGILYALALLTVLFGIGIFFWALAMGHAMWEFRKELMRDHAKMIAEEMVKAQAAAANPR